MSHSSLLTTWPIFRCKLYNSLDNSRNNILVVQNAGISSAIAVLWLFLDIRRLSKGRTITGRTIKGEWGDRHYSFVAVTAFSGFFCIPVWSAILVFRTGLWLLTCGKVFGRVLPKLN
jgi:hypothetical protein